jgi:hypothetical protein
MVVAASLGSCRGDDDAGNGLIFLNESTLAGSVENAEKTTLFTDLDEAAPEMELILWVVEGGGAQMRGLREAERCGGKAWREGKEEKGTMVTLTRGNEKEVGVRMNAMKRRGCVRHERIEVKKGFCKNTVVTSFRTEGVIHLYRSPIPFFIFHLVENRTRYVPSEMLDLFVDGFVNFE